MSVGTESLEQAMALGEIVPEHRIRMMRAISGPPSTLALEINAPALHYLHVHFPVAKIDHALSYLISNHLIGIRFTEYFKFECAGSFFELQRKLLMAVEKTREFKKLGPKDFRH